MIRNSVNGHDTSNALLLIWLFLTLIFSLVDLGEENDRTLILPYNSEASDAVSSDLTVVEAAEKAITQIVEQASEKHTKVSELKEIGKNKKNK